MVLLGPKFNLPGGELCERAKDNVRGLKEGSASASILRLHFCHFCHGQKPCICCEFSLALEDIRTVILRIYNQAPCQGTFETLWAGECTDTCGTCLGNEVLPRQYIRRMTIGSDLRLRWLSFLPSAFSSTERWWEAISYQTCWPKLYLLIQSNLGKGERYNDILPLHLK